MIKKPTKTIPIKGSSFTATDEFPGCASRWARRGLMRVSYTFYRSAKFGHVRNATSRPPESGIWENAPPNAARGEEIYKLAQ